MIQKEKMPSKAWETCPREGKSKQNQSTRNHSGVQLVPNVLLCGCTVSDGTEPNLQNTLPGLLLFWQVEVLVVVLVALVVQVPDNPYLHYMTSKNLSCTNHLDHQGNHRTQSLNHPKHSNNNLDRPPPQQTQQDQQQEKCFSWLFKIGNDQGNDQKKK